jgi:LytS/YehU family sensor histidine kinase
MHKIDPNLDHVMSLNDIETKLEKASAICNLTAHFDKISDQVPDHTLENAMWAASDMIKEASEDARKLVSKLNSTPLPIAEKVNR